MAVAAQIVDEGHKEAPNRDLIAAKRAELSRLTAASSSLTTQRMLGFAEGAWNRERLHTLAWSMAREKAKAAPDENQIAQWKAEMKALMARPDDPNNRYLDFARFGVANEVTAHIIAELRKDTPDMQRVHELQASYNRIFDELGAPYNSPHREDTRETFRLLNELPASLQEAAQRNDTERVSNLEEQRINLLNALANSNYQYGDPLITVEAPADARGVVAVMPDGTTKNLRYEAAAHRWEARFEVPEYSQSGAHEIVIIVLQRDGTRRRLTLRFQVDVTAPRGVGSARNVAKNGHQKWRLEARGDSDTARVAALLPWNARVELEPSAQDKTLFFAIVAPPQDFTGAPRVTFVLTDRAHNRTQITVALAP